MHTGKFLWTLFLLAASVLGAEPVKVQLNSYSLLFRPAKFRQFGNDYWVEVSSAPFYPLSNGEVEFAPAGVPYTHWGYFLYRDPILSETAIFDFVLDVPPDDANGNDTPDILEYSQAVGARTTGEYLAGDEAGTFTCDWLKAENSHIGSCKVTFDFGQNFPHQFEIFEYAGAWTNAVMSGTNGTVNLHLDRAGVEGEFLEGPLAFSIANLKLRINKPGELKTQANAPFKWDAVSASTLRNGRITTFANVIDGTPTTDPDVWNAEDFNDWQLLIMDPNDGDGDGTPDLLEGTSVTPATQPRLEILKTQNGIRILIHGEVGRTYVLEDAAGLPTTDWLHPTNVQANEAITSVDLPAPTSAVYWRARVL